MKNMNKIALSGGDITDAEVVEFFGLDPALIGDPKINDAVAEVVYQSNIESAIKDGMPEKEARAKAGANRSKTMAEANRLVKEHKNK